jgi:Tol biopolymer transport system component
VTPDRLQRIEQLFHEARAQSDSARNALIAVVCEGDPELRRDVESLLAHAAGGALATPLLDAAAALAPSMVRLENGVTIGAYRIESFIAAGGMGDVYRARDSRLGRSVALKRLPPSFTGDPDRIARFSREAQLLAALNHPHIAQIHGFEQSGDTQFLVLELVDGDTLDSHIAGRPLPINEALQIASQIAMALEAAHDKGIVHRDLKPANIALTRDRCVKILDFGLAKTVEPLAAGSPKALTDVGIVLGTTAYMAPEQAAGRRVDKRADVWAFGCVLFEMLTGARAFGGGDVQETLALVMAHTPEWKKLPAATPPAVERLLRRCLEKDALKRLRDVGDALLEISDARANTFAPADVSSASIGVARRFTRVAWFGALVVAAVIGAFLAGRQAATTTGATSPVRRLAMTFSGAAALSPLIRQFTLSADGNWLAYVGTNGRIWLRGLNAPEVRELAGTDGAWNPFFSPDGQWIGYIDAGAWGGGAVARPGKLKKIAARGGVPTELAEAAAIGASWGHDGTIVFCGRTDAGVALFTISASGGTPKRITTPVPGNAAFRVGWPSLLPDDTTVLFSETDQPTFESGRTVALSLRTGERRVVLDQGYGARYVPPGYLLYALNGSLMAVAFDARRLTTIGSPVPIVSSVFAGRQVGWVGFSAANGLLLYDAGPDQSADQSLEWVRSGAAPIRIVDERGSFSYPRLSPDGRRLAVGVGSDIWIFDLNRGTRSRIAAQERGNYPAPPIASWTWDGRRLAINVRNTTDTSLLVLDPDDAEHRTVLLRRPYFMQVGSWSRDGALAFFQIPGASARDVWVLDPGKTEPRPFASTEFNERGAVFSPDGRWIAYAADPTGRDEIYVRPYPGPGTPIAVSTGGGTEPVWARNGREIFYRDVTRLLSVSFGAAPAVALGQPRLIFDQPFAASNLGVADYDVDGDGRFVMIAAGDRATRPMELVAVSNWFGELAGNWTEELKQRFPVP